MSKRRLFRFTLIELLLIIATVAVLVSMLFPALRRARENSSRAACLNNLKQFYMGLEMYADDNDQAYPHHGYSGTFLHLMTLKIAFRQNYLNDDVSVMYCTSANYRYNHRTLDLARKCTDRYFGYAYLGGIGGDTRDWTQPTGWVNCRSAYTPTINRHLANRSVKTLAERPLIMDNAGQLGAAWMRQEQASRPAFPGNNHNDGDTRVGTYENIMFLDGHGEGIPDPLQRPQRFYYWRLGSFRW